MSRYHADHRLTLILMILIVTLFEGALKMQLTSSLDLLYLGGGIALVGLALYLTHRSESHGKEDHPPASH